jgi:hypothetical protein
MNNNNASGNRSGLSLPNFGKGARQLSDDVKRINPPESFPFNFPNLSRNKRSRQDSSSEYVPPEPENPPNQQIDLENPLSSEELNNSRRRINVDDLANNVRGKSIPFTIPNNLPNLGSLSSSLPNKENELESNTEAPTSIPFSIDESDYMNSPANMGSPPSGANTSTGLYLGNNEIMANSSKFNSFIANSDFIPSSNSNNDYNSVLNFHPF